MRISIIGWASLVTAPGSLSLSEPFRPGGPELSLEFSHVALDGRLTVIIDEAHGVLCPTQYAVSSHINLNHAIRELKEREGLRYASRVGWINWTGLGAGNLRWFNLRSYRLHRTAHNSILYWLIQLTTRPDFDAVIWTASYPNFHLQGKGGEPFSLEAVRRYLDRLPPEGRALASRYARSVPAEVRTPARQLIEQ